jgi:hypothetical protein
MKRAAVVVCLALAACAQQPSIQQPVSAPQDFPFEYYKKARPALEVDPARSLVVIVVRRGGSLARLGHDHVVASHDVRGFVAPADGRADLYFALERLVVDEAPLRAEAGLETTPSAEDIEGTRRNMLASVEADKYPFAVVRIEESGAASVTLHGVTREIRIPISVERTAGEISAAGRFEILQTDFGITPLSVLGGRIQVQDRLELRFHIVAGPVH